MRYVKTIRLLYRLTPGSLWCAWQSHSTDPTNQSAAKYTCSKQFAFTSWSLPSICINQNHFVMFQVTHQHLRSQQSHYVLLQTSVVGDKDIVIKLCCCNKHRAINQKCISTGELKLWVKHNTTVWHSLWKWTSGFQGRTLRKKKYFVLTFSTVIISSLTTQQLKLLCMVDTQSLTELFGTSYNTHLTFPWIVDLKCSYPCSLVAKTLFSCVVGIINLGCITLSSAR